ncbi:MAG: TIGR02710 family CRISPR-associated CARF protein [Candidatus Helarchaeota archaeon]
MKIEKILVIKDTIYQYSLPEDEETTKEPDDGLVSGYLSAINGFIKEVYKENLRSEVTDTHRITLIKKDNFIIAFFTDKASFRFVPDIIKNYIFELLKDKDHLDLLKIRLKNLFFPEIDPEIQRKGLLITVGYSISPIWFAISQHSPEYVAFIVSDDTKTIALNLIKFFGFELEINAKIFTCNPDDTTSIAEAGINAVDFLKNIGLTNDQILSNYTGGKKVMTAAISHISFIEGIQSYYVLSPHSQKNRNDKIYGDEKILLLDNPSDTLGIIFKKYALDSFNSLNFKKAADYFAKLKRVSDANQREIYFALYELSLAYENWDLFDFKPAVSHLERSAKNFEKSKKSKFGKQFKKLYSKISKQLTILTNLRNQKLDNFDEIPLEILLTLYFELINNARRKTQLKKFDDAVSRYYRIFEATAQLILWKKYNINTSNFDESANKLPSHVKKIFRYKNIKTPSILLNLALDIFNPVSLPPTIALKNSWLLLEHLNPDIKKLKILNKIKKVLSIRNLSILAHGWIPIKEKSIKKFEEIIPYCIQLIQNSFVSDYPEVQNLQEILKFVQLS